MKPKTTRIRLTGSTAALILGLAGIGAAPAIADDTPSPTPEIAETAEALADIETAEAPTASPLGTADPEAPAGSADGTADPEADAESEANGGTDSELELAAKGFSDVPATHAQYSDIMWLANRKVTSGWGDGTFRPNGIVPRDAMAAFLYRYAGSPAYTPPATSRFKDVPTTHRFYKEISWAATSGLTTGYADGTFKPDASVTRGAVATFLWRLAGTPGATPGSAFVDAGIGTAQSAAIRWLSRAGLANGYSDHTFQPEKTMTRADLATFLHRYDTKGYGVKATPATPAKDPVFQASLFRDVPSSNKFQADIAWLSATGITGGYRDGTFKPNAAVTRDATTAFLYRFAGSPDYTPPAKSPFKDISTSHPFYKEISWAAASGIASGYPDGTFKPTATVNRAAMATFLYRAAGNPGSPRGAQFADTRCSEHRTAISWLAGAGITTGYSGNTFRPNAPVERQALAAFLHRMNSKGYRVVSTPWSKVAATKDAIPGSCIATPNPVAKGVALAPTPESNKAIARAKMASYGWNEAQFQCLVKLWNRESGWNHLARNPNGGAYGIPQALPASKLASAGADWRTNPETQINWGLGYIKGRYRTPCNAWAHSERYNWY